MPRLSLRSTASSTRRDRRHPDPAWAVDESPSGTGDEGVTRQTPNWRSRGCRGTGPGVNLNAHEGQRTTDAKAKAGAPPGVSRRAGTDARQRISSVAPPSVTSDAGPAPIPSVRWADVARAGYGQHAAMGSGVTPAPAGEAHRCARLGSGTAQRGPAIDRSRAPLSTFRHAHPAPHRYFEPGPAAAKRPESTTGAFDADRHGQ